mmetsp:Transcript_3639/g.9460  ORF Transcript_3639/g.9460 Transcript_3639/m.9460 type:complete len:828 (+) Transcript_3639:1555-4038(+)
MDLLHGVPQHQVRRDRPQVPVSHGLLHRPRAVQVVQTQVRAHVARVRLARALHKVHGDLRVILVRLLHHLVQILRLGPSHRGVIQVRRQLRQAKLRLVQAELLVVEQALPDGVPPLALVLHAHVGRDHKGLRDDVGAALQGEPHVYAAHEAHLALAGLPAHQDVHALEARLVRRFGVLVRVAPQLHAPLLDVGVGVLWVDGPAERKVLEAGGAGAQCRRVARVVVHQELVQRQANGLGALLQPGSEGVPAEVRGRRVGVGLAVVVADVRRLGALQVVALKGVSREGAHHALHLLRARQLRQPRAGGRHVVQVPQQGGVVDPNGGRLLEKETSLLHAAGEIDVREDDGAVLGLAQGGGVRVVQVGDGLQRLRLRGGGRLCVLFARAVNTLEVVHPLHREELVECDVRGVGTHALRRPHAAVGHDPAVDARKVAQPEVKEELGGGEANGVEGLARAAGWRVALHLRAGQVLAAVVKQARRLGQLRRLCGLLQVKVHRQLLRAVHTGVLMEAPPQLLRLPCVILMRHQLDLGGRQGDGAAGRVDDADGELERVVEVRLHHHLLVAAPSQQLGGDVGGLLQALRQRDADAAPGLGGLDHVGALRVQLLLGGPLGQHGSGVAGNGERQQRKLRVAQMQQLLTSAGLVEGALRRKRRSPNKRHVRRLQQPSQSPVLAPTAVHHREHHARAALQVRRQLRQVGVRAAHGLQLARGQLVVKVARRVGVELRRGDLPRHQARVDVVHVHMNAASQAVVGTISALLITLHLVLRAAAAAGRLELVHHGPGTGEADAALRGGPAAHQRHHRRILQQHRQPLLARLEAAPRGVQRGAAA